MQAQLNETRCYELLRRVRWPQGVVCPYCGHARVTPHSKPARTPRRRYLCLGCRRTFTDLTGTPLARTHLRMSTWFLLLRLQGERRSTAELARRLGVKWDTAAHLQRRLTQETGASPLLAKLRRAAQDAPARRTKGATAMRTRTLSGFLLLALSIIGLAAGAASAQASGKQLYLKHCAVCHGTDGQARTPVGRLLNPPPRDFADPVGMSRVSFDRMYRAIKEGRPGTSMASWATVLTEIEIGDLIDYILTLAPRGDAALTPEQLSLEVGRRLYKRGCVVCHGEDGRADTEAAKVLHPPPRNFADPVEMARVDDGRMYLAIKVGRSGTAMASWAHLLTPEEIIDVMRYVRTLVRPLPAGMTAADLDLEVGRRIYGQYCLSCHGEKGDGQTQLGRTLDPRPRDFSDSRAMTAIADKDLARGVMDGRPGTAMAPWRGVLNPEDVRRVILYIRARFQKGA